MPANKTDDRGVAVFGVRAPHAPSEAIIAAAHAAHDAWRANSGEDRWERVVYAVAAALRARPAADGGEQGTELSAVVERVNRASQALYPYLRFGHDGKALPEAKAAAKEYGEANLAFGRAATPPGAASGEPGA